MTSLPSRCRFGSFNQFDSLSLGHSSTLVISRSRTMISAFNCIFNHLSTSFNPFRYWKVLILSLFLTRWLKAGFLFLRVLNVICLITLLCLHSFWSFISSVSNFFGNCRCWLVDPLTLRDRFVRFRHFVLKEDLSQTYWLASSWKWNSQVELQKSWIFRHTYPKWLLRGNSWSRDLSMLTRVTYNQIETWIRNTPKLGGMGNTFLAAQIPLKGTISQPSSTHFKSACCSHDLKASKLHLQSALDLICTMFIRPHNMVSSHTVTHTCGRDYKKIPKC